MYINGSLTQCNIHMTSVRILHGANFTTCNCRTTAVSTWVVLELMAREQKGPLYWACVTTHYCFGKFKGNCRVCIKNCLELDNSGCALFCLHQNELSHKRYKMQTNLILQKCRWRVKTKYDSIIAGSFWWIINPHLSHWKHIKWNSILCIIH